MRTQYVSKTQDELVVDLVRLIPELVLTGSRYFGTSNLNSDWDFMLQEGNEFLLPPDFDRVHEPRYTELDPTVTSVYKSFMRNVHIQVVPDLQLKIRAQELLKETGALNKVPKELQKYIWKAVVTALERS